MQTSIYVSVYVSDPGEPLQRRVTVSGGANGDATFDAGTNSLQAVFALQEGAMAIVQESFLKAFSPTWRPSGVS